MAWLRGAEKPGSQRRTRLTTSAIAGLAEGRAPPVQAVRGPNPAQGRFCFGGAERSGWREAIQRVILKGGGPNGSKTHIRDPTEASPTARKSDPPVLRVGLPTPPFGLGNCTGVRGFFRSDRRYPGCGAEKAGGHGVDCYSNPRSCPMGSRTPTPTRRAAVAGIQEEVLVWSSRAWLVLIRSRSERGQQLPIPGELLFRTANWSDLSGCAGINRHVVGDERALRERRKATPSWP